MTVTRTEIDSFHRFAVSKLNDDGNDLSFEELVDLWLVENTSHEGLQKDVLAVKAAIRDMENGDRGIPLDEHLRELHEKLDPTAADE
jgi:hypothetical protein